MKAHAQSFATGGLVGVVYGLLGVTAPAPPVVALVGLLGILLGEQVLPVGCRLVRGTGFLDACEAAATASHLFGRLPGRHTRLAPHTDVTTTTPETQR